MILEYLTPTARRQLLARVAALTAAMTSTVSTHVESDAPLLAACAAFSCVERQKLALIEGPERIESDDERDEALAPLLDRQVQFLDAMCDRQAQSFNGHRARATAYLLWDGGELAYRARQSGSIEDRILAALVRDLAGTPLLAAQSDPASGTDRNGS